jgi:MFS family permease
MSHERLTGSDDASGGPLSAREQITLSFFWLALNLQYAAFLPVVIPAQILLFVAPGAVGNAQQAVFLGWLSALSAVISLVAQPIIGTLSDRTPGPLGRRRPYIVAGTLVLIAGMAALGVTRAMGVFIAAFALTNIGSNITTAAYQSLLPDRVPAEQRGAASGYMGFMTIVGNVGSLAIAFLLLGQVSPGSSLAQVIQTGAARFYLLAAVVLVLGLMVTLIGVRETPLARRPRRPEAVEEQVTARESGRARLREGLVRLWVDPWRHSNFARVFLTRCFVILGLTLFMTFIAYYFSQVKHVTAFLQETAAIALLALLGAICSALSLGIISDHTRRVPVVFLATILMAVASLAFVVAPDSVPLWPLGIIFGLGYGAYTSVDWALAIDALPSLTEAGKDMGLWNIASTLPAALAPLLGSVVIVTADRIGETALGYRVVFGLAAFFFLLGAVLVLKVQERPKGHDHSAVADALGA